MALPNDNRTILLIGGGLAVVAAVVLALVFGAGGPNSAEKAPVETGDLTVDLADAPALESTRQLRCFVAGQFVGMATLEDCAGRNGLATDALDVGLDETGALSAAPTAAFAPPPQLPAEMAEGPIMVDPGAGASTPVAGPAGAGDGCLRYAGSEWRSVGNGLTLAQCVRALYAGTCVRPGDAQYGRYGDMTLRLVPRRVEQSNDNARFRLFTDQDRNCQFPGLG